MSFHDDANGKPDSVGGPGGPADGLSSRGQCVKHESVGSASSSPEQKEISEKVISDNASSSIVKSRSESRSPVKVEPDNDEISSKIGGDITVKLEPGKPPKLSRSSSQKVIAQPPQLFHHLPSSINEACKTFDVIDSCTYANKYMGYTEHAMECDCSEEWGESCSDTSQPLFIARSPLLVTWTRWIAPRILYVKLLSAIRMYLMFLLTNHFRT
jgi:histone-lysine N-methyltransferase SETD2